MDLKRTYRVLIFIGITVAAVLFAVLLLPRLIVLVLPFLIAFLIAKIIEPLVDLLTKKIKIPRKLSSAIVVAVVLALLIWLVISVSSRVVAEITNLVYSADKIAENVTKFLNNWEKIIGERFGEGAAKFLSAQISSQDFGNSIKNYLTGYIWPTLERLLGIVKSLPNMLIFTVVLILGTYFISSDSQNVNEGIKKLFPKSSHTYLRGMKNDMSHALIGYVRAQLILMFITFIECSVGFALIGGEIAGYALLLGIAISIIDALPILGTGTVLIPWGLGAIITGNVTLGLYLLVLYGICLTVRQLLEPRIVSGQIGLHPIITLMSMYVGLKTIGFLGMIIGPVLALVIKNLATGGVFRMIRDYVWYGKEANAEER